MVTIDNYVDFWMLEEELVAQSLWNDTQQPPPIQFSQAFSIATDLVTHLNRNASRIQYQDVEIDQLALVRVDFDSHCWAYQISLSASQDGKRGWLQLSLLLLMDGTLAMDPTYYRTELVAVIGEFDSSRELRVVMQGHE